VTSVFEGLTDEVDEELLEEWKRANLQDWLTMHRTFDLLRIHFHPEYGEPLALSPEDIRSVDGETHAFRTISGIGSVDVGGQGYFLLLQRTTDTAISGCPRDVIEEMMSDYQEARQNSWSPERLTTVLERGGYLRAGVLRFARPRARSPPMVQNAEIMSRFEYACWTTPVADSQDAQTVGR
jgi:hypothetical protein